MNSTDAHDPDRDPLSALLENSTDAFCALDRGGNCIYANRAAERILGARREQLIGRSVLETAPPWLSKAAEGPLRRAMEGQGTVEFRVPWEGGGESAADGDTGGRWLNVRLCPSDRGLAVYFHDTTRPLHADEAHAAAEEALRERDARLQLIVDAAPVLISYIDGNCRYQLANRTYHQWFGLSPAAIQGKHVSEVLGEGAWEAVRPHMQRALAGEVVTYEQQLPYARLGPRWVQVTYSPDRGTNGDVRGFVVLVHDVEESKRSEAALREAKADAEHASRAKDQFLAVLSHELRTPLTPVVMTVAAMEMDRTLSPQMREDLAMIRRNIELETKLIDDLLDVTRIANGKLRLAPLPSDVHALARNVLEILSSDIAQKGLEVSVELHASDATVSADPARLQQVLWNLLKNAVKFTRPGGRIALRSFNPSERRLCVEVLDDGVGIDPAVLPRVFDAFEQGDPAVTRQFGGLGLGLAISRALIEMHGGTLCADSSGVGQGARFTIELPTRIPAQPIPHPPGPPGAERDAREQVRVLLVEDHPDTRKTLRRLLEARGLQVFAASSVSEAQQRLSAGPVDVLVSDIGLPDGTGLDLMRYARGARDIPGIAVSGFGSDADFRNSTEAGFAAHFTKPVDLAQLESMIRALASRVGPGATMKAGE